jgi:nitronate monooxygenase
MGAVATVELAAAVAAAGGVGMLSADNVGVSEFEEKLDRLCKLTAGVFGVNVLVPYFSDPAYIEIATAYHARLVEFFYGEPDRTLIDVVHRGGALAAWQIGSRDEAMTAQNAGCDLIVAQGVEAGGHVRGRLGLLPLLSEVLEAVTCPVVAAGGIGTGRALAATLVAGASAVRVGTRFVAASESGAHPKYIDALIAATPEDTTLTEAFSLTWPNAPHRVLRSCVEAAERFPGDVVGEIIADGGRRPVRRWASTEPSRTTNGAIEAMALYAGQSVGAVRRIEPASEIINSLLLEAETCLGLSRDIHLMQARGH